MRPLNTLVIFNTVYFNDDKLQKIICRPQHTSILCVDKVYTIIHAQPRSRKHVDSLIDKNKYILSYPS